MKHALVVKPGQEYVARSDDQVRLVLWRCDSGERYHLYRQDIARGVDELVGVYPSPTVALADAEQMQI